MQRYLYIISSNINCNSSKYRTYWCDNLLTIMCFYCPVFLFSFCLSLYPFLLSFFSFFHSSFSPLSLLLLPSLYWRSNSWACACQAGVCATELNPRPVFSSLFFFSCFLSSFRETHYIIPNDGKSRNMVHSILLGFGISSTNLTKYYFCWWTPLQTCQALA